MDPARTDELIAQRGVRPNLTVAQWHEFIALALQHLRPDPCYRFCLYPYSHVPEKGYMTGFPAKILGDLKYLNLLDLIVSLDEPRAHLTAFLDQHGCPWETLTRCDPETEADEPMGIRIYGYGSPAEGAIVMPTAQSPAR